MFDMGSSFALKLLRKHKGRKTRIQLSALLTSDQRRHKKACTRRAETVEMWVDRRLFLGPCVAVVSSQAQFLSALRCIDVRDESDPHCEVDWHADVHSYDVDGELVCIVGLNLPKLATLTPIDTAAGRHDQQLERWDVGWHFPRSHESRDLAVSHGANWVPVASVHVHTAALLGRIAGADQKSSPRRIVVPHCLTSPHEQISVDELAGDALAGDWLYSDFAAMAGNCATFAALYE